MVGLFPHDPAFHRADLELHHPFTRPKAKVNHSLARVIAERSYSSLACGLTGSIRPVSSRYLMNLNGPSQSTTSGAYAAPLGAIKATAMRRLSHLVLWVSPEQC